MSLALRPPRAIPVKVVAVLALTVGVPVTACTGTPTDGDRGDNAHLTTVDHSGHQAGTGDVATATGVPDPVASDGDEHHHGQGELPDSGAATTGPARPADSDLPCGTTVLPDGEQVVRYCEDGTAVFTLGDHEEAEVQGTTCENRGALFLAHFGTNYSDDTTARGEYLGLALEDVPESSGAASIYALELTVGGYRQPVAEASVEVAQDGSTLTLELDGSLTDGRELLVRASCHVHDG